jgi:hypothetical protein
MKPLTRVDSNFEKLAFAHEFSLTFVESFDMRIFGIEYNLTSVPRVHHGHGGQNAEGR